MKDDLISRKAAIDRLNAIPPGNWSKTRYTRELWNVPSVPAVPLDKLCECLSENSINIPCEACPNFSNEYCTAIGDPSKPCPKTANDWRRVITEWMEEQDAAD